MMQATVDEVAEALGVTPKTIRAWIREGLPTINGGAKGPGRGAILDLARVLAWYIERRRGDELYQAQVRLTREQADRIALQDGERRAQLGELAVWKQELVPLFRRICRLIGTLPALAPRLTGNLNQRQAVLDDAVRSILSRLSMPPSRWPRRSK